MGKGFILEVPVLLIGFNRPDLIKQAIENLRQQNVQNLYITIDGPRPNRADDIEKVDEVRTLVNSIDFCPNIHLKIRDDNAGCEINVSEGITWALENEEYVLVLEDDVMAHESFFRFMQDMLIRYKENSEIAMVSGSNYTPVSLPNDEDYCFCQYGHTGGGWATWKRVWKGFSLYEEVDGKYLSIDFLRFVSVNNEIAKRRRNSFAKMQKRGAGNNTWDVMFYYFRITRQLLSIVPRSHLTSNVGVFGYHCQGVDKGLMMEIDEDFVARNHPATIVWNKEYDLYHFNHYIKESLFRKAVRYAKRKWQKLKAKV